MEYDKIIIGGGFYGFYSALFCGKLGQKILLLEHDPAPFMRATYINQARVHMGYHYPRSYSTAIKSARYFDRFNHDFGFCVNTSFDQIYATSSRFSWSNANQFRKFCDNTGILYEEVSPEKYFRTNMCDGAFLTKEYTYDAQILKNYFVEEIKKYPNIQVCYNTRIWQINRLSRKYEIIMNDGEKVQTGFVLNSTYASVNQIIQKLGFESFKIKYELCEIILCQASDSLKKTGLTVMDGPFFSIMPFGKTGMHSLTAVTFTPHMTSYSITPEFTCQKHSGGYCSSQQLGNCNDCPAKPHSAWNYMSNLAKKYIKDSYGFKYAGSLFSMKPILKQSEIDDSRPTVIRQFTRSPTFVSVLSGKVNTVYDLDEVLQDGNE